MSARTLYLGNKNYSSWSLRPWLVLRHAGLAFDEVIIPLDRPDTDTRIRAASPAGRVPILHDGELVIWDSLSICEYAAELAPAAGLWPDDRGERARARSVSSEMHSGFAAMRGSLCMNIRRPPSPVPSDAAVDADIARIVALWTECRRRSHRAGDFLFGRFTIADAMFAPVVTRFRSYAVPITGPAAEYAEAMSRLPLLQEWVAAAVDEPLRIEKYEHAPAR
jgi:glutathione S-transferase